MGIEAETVTVIKNGVDCEGVRLKSTNVGAILYYSEEESIRHFELRLREVMRKKIPSIDVKTILSKEYFEKNCYICVQKSSKENIIKKDYLNLEAFLKIRIDDFLENQFGSIKVSKEILLMAGMSEEEVWECSLKNTRRSLVICSALEIFGFGKKSDRESLMYIAFNENGLDGASALLFPDLFYDFCKKKAWGSCTLLPSSTQEIMVFPRKQDEDYDFLIEMVDSINKKGVNPEEQLTPAVYHYEIGSNQIFLAAEMQED